MKKHLNTLFVTTEGAYLRKEGQAVVVRVEKQTRLRVPLHNLDGIVCFGRVGCSPALMASCAKGNVSISFLNPYGGFLAAVTGFTPGNVLLRRQQYRAADAAESTLAIAKEVVAGKIANSRSVLLRAARDISDPDAQEQLQRAARRMANDVTMARNETSLDALRGREGESAATYFQVFSSMISPQATGFAFTTRSRRPPLDPLNALLSFLYSMLTHDARSACEAAGLDAAVGFLHRDRPGRPGLALDLIEEFRAFLVDRLTLSLINRRQIQSSDFEITQSGAVLLKDKPRKTVLAAYQKRKQATITHPFLDEKTTIGLLIHLQARLLARHLRGDLDAYPPFLWR
ncbi:type I-C CRISPR-associated endonuclease Cas1c [Rosistilla oblonga]|uniref:type I-C CRISPR-associated endonuclease Cas1c n=1 Tax=Rosistilla oblonga TaxID=2527990 RepID=UPI003A974283